MQNFVLDNVCPAGRPFRPDCVTVEFGPRFCRVPPADDPEDARIEATWQQRKQQLGKSNPSARLFNALKFRLHGIEASIFKKKDKQSAGDHDTENHLVLKLGLTDYKSHVGTNAADVFDSLPTASSPSAMNTDEQQQQQLLLQQQQENDYENDDGRANTSTNLASACRCCCADALGVEACIVTSDDYCLLFRRSQHVAEFPGYYCCPGGHAEPWRVFSKVAHAASAATTTTTTTTITTTGGARRDIVVDRRSERLDEAIPENVLRQKCLEWAAATATATASTETPSSSSDHLAYGDLIKQELFFSMADECASETGIPLEQIDVQGILGVVRNTAQRGKPDLLFAVRLRNVTLADAKKFFAKRQGEDSFEAVDGSLIGLPVDVVASEQYKEVMKKIAPASAAALNVAFSQWLR